MQELLSSVTCTHLSKTDHWLYANLLLISLKDKKLVHSTYYFFN